MPRSRTWTMVSLLFAAACGRDELSEPELSGDAAESSLTWSGRIHEIVQDNCIRCHSSGRFSTYNPLATYDQVVAQAADLPAKLAFPPGHGTQMPPYPGGSLPGTCEPPTSYSNDLRLSNDDLNALSSWLQAGTPRGAEPLPVEPLVVPTASTLPDTTTYEFSEGYVMFIDQNDPVGHKDDWVCVVVDPGTIGGSRYLSGLQINPDQQQVFRGAVVWLDRNRESLAHLQPGSTRAHGTRWYDCDAGFGFDGEILGGFLPAGEPITTPPGTAIEIPGDALLVVKIHYHGHYAPVDPTDTTPLPFRIEWDDRTSLAVQWKQPGEVGTIATALTVGNYPDPVVDGTGNLTHPFQISPSSNATAVETMVTSVPGPSTAAYVVWAVQTEMKEAGRTVTVTVEGDASQCLAAVPRWDTSWQLPLTYDVGSGNAPIVFGGQRIRVDCTYANRSPMTLTLEQESCRAMIGLVPRP